MKMLTRLLLTALCLAAAELPNPSASAGENTPSTKLIVLPDMVEPQSMSVDRDRIFITEKHKIFVYSSDDHRLLKTFGKVGDEPDAFRKSGGRELRLILDVSGDDAVISSHERISSFSKHGEFKKIVGESPQVDYMAALGPKYVASAYVIEAGTGKSYQHVVLFDGEMEFIKTVAESHLGAGSAKGFGGPDRKMHLDLVPDYYGFVTYKDRIYLGDSHKGFYFEVFDADGEKLYAIDRDYQPIKIPEEYKKERLEKIGQYRSYQRYKESTVIDEAEYLPAFRSFTVSEGCIYVYTHHRRKGEQEVAVLDLEGNHVNTVFVPKADGYCVYGGKYYFVTANDDDEWELHVTAIDFNSSEEHRGEAVE